VIAADALPDGPGLLSLDAKLFGKGRGSRNSSIEYSIAQVGINWRLICAMARAESLNLYTIMEAQMSDEELMVGDRKVDKVNKEQLIELLNGDLSREYQAIITYIQYRHRSPGRIARS
jgi:hypothetical protein